MSDEDYVKFKNALKAQLLPHVAMIGYFTDPKMGPEGVVGNGTVSFIDTGSEKLLVTNRHVLDEFEEFKLSYPKAQLVVSGASGRVPISISDAISIGSGQNVDIATLKLPNPRSIEEIGKCYRTVMAWPPAQPSIDEAIYFIGYPSQYRTPKQGNLMLAPSIFSDFVTSIRGTDIVMDDQNNERILVKYNPELLPPESLKGISGSAVYRLDENQRQLHLCGFIYGCNPKIGGQVFQATFLACTAGVISERGLVQE